MAGKRELEAVLLLTGKLDPSLARAIQKAVDELEPVQKKARDVAAEWEKTGKALTKTGKSLTKSITMPLAAAAAYAVNEVRKFEDASVSMRKTVDATEAEYKRLEKMATTLGNKKPYNPNETLEVMGVAGQLGIANDQLMTFTETVMGLEQATDMLRDDAATNMAQFANIMGMDQANFGRMGSTIVGLGNNFATTESKILDMSMRLAGAANQVDMSEANVLALATGLSSVGIEAEMGGSAVSKVMLNIDMDVARGEKAVAKYAKVAGMSAKDFAAAWETDAAGGLVAFIGGLQRVQQQGGNLGLTLEKLGYAEMRTRTALLNMVGAGDLLTSSISLANQEWERNTALQDEVEKRNATMTSRLQILQNRFITTARSFGELIMPYVEQGMGALERLTDRLTNMDDATKQNILGWLKFAAALGPGLLLLGKFYTAGSKVITLWTSFQKARTMFKAGKDFATATGSVKSFGLALKLLSGPTGWIMGALGAVALLTYTLNKAHDDMIRKNVADRFGDISMAAEDMEEAVREAKGPLSEAVQAYLDEMDNLQSMQDSFNETSGNLSDIVMQASLKVNGLTEGDKQLLINKVNSFMAGARLQLGQQHVVDNLALDAMPYLDDQTKKDIKSGYDELFASLQGDLQTKGHDLERIFNEALLDDVITAEEMALAAAKQAEILELVAMATAIDPERVKLESKIRNGTLTPEEAKNLGPMLEAFTAQERVNMENVTYHNIGAAERELNYKIMQGLTPEEELVARQDFKDKEQIHLDALAMWDAGEKQDNANMVAAALASSLQTAMGGEVDLSTINLDFQGYIQQAWEDMVYHYSENMGIELSSEDLKTEDIQLRLVSRVRTLVGSDLANMEDIGELADTARIVLDMYGGLVTIVEDAYNSFVEAEKPVPENIQKAYDEILRLRLLTQGADAMYGDGLEGAMQQFIVNQEAQPEISLPEFLLPVITPAADAADKSGWWITQQAAAAGMDLGEGYAPAIEQTEAITKYMRGTGGQAWSAGWIGLQGSMGTALGAMATDAAYNANLITGEVNKVPTAVQEAQEAISSLGGFTPGGGSAGTSGSDGGGNGGGRKFALGGTVYGPTNALIGEAGYAETVVPHTPTARSRSLAMEALRGTGMSVGGTGFVFSPTIHVVVQGGGDQAAIREAVASALRETKDDLRALLAQIQREEMMEQYA